MTKKTEDQHGAFRGKDALKAKEGNASEEVEEDPIGNAIELEAAEEATIAFDNEVGKEHQSPPLPPDSPVIAVTVVDGDEVDEKPELVTKIDGLDLDDIKMVSKT